MNKLKKMKRAGEKKTRRSNGDLRNCYSHICLRDRRNLLWTSTKKVKKAGDMNCWKRHLVSFKITSGDPLIVETIISSHFWETKPKARQAKYLFRYQLWKGESIFTKIWVCVSTGIAQSVLYVRTNHYLPIYGLTDESRIWTWTYLPDYLISWGTAYQWFIIVAL